jgi:GNAT superfamily N-acetyltransferase
MRIAAGDLEIEVRAGEEEDVPLLLRFIRSMADFEKLEVKATEEILRENLFGKPPAAHSLLAFVEGRPAAYAVYFFTFSTMVGKRCLWLDDLYVTPEFRGKGIARALMAYLADLAATAGCGRLEWIVLDWNKPAIDFYRRLGAAVLDEWWVCRLDEGGMARVAEGLEVLDDTI